MLQQTQATRVVTPFVRWVAEFPDAPSCARAGPAAAIAAWRGLGYNRRALNLHRSAAMVTEDLGGQVPSGQEALRRLPGVGPYTARAVMAFAFGAPVGVVDTNVARVLCRVSGRPCGRSDAQVLADRLVPAAESWAYNQTLFDIGAVHCKARGPHCEDCPLRGRCAWAASGWGTPDPAAKPAGGTSFAGSDREGRGRIVAALLGGPLVVEDLARVTGWNGEGERVARVVESLVADGLAVRAPDGRLCLP